MRLVFAILASSTVVIPLYFLIVFLMDDLDNQLLLLTAYVALIISALGVILVGVPTHFILLKLKKQKFYYYAAPGFFVPMLAMMIGQPFGKKELPDALIEGLQMGGFGLVAALVFWSIAVPRSAA